MTTSILSALQRIYVMCGIAHILYRINFNEKDEINKSI